jgi:hypothetical protein
MVVARKPRLLAAVALLAKRLEVVDVIRSTPVLREFMIDDEHDAMP